MRLGTSHKKDVTSVSVGGHEPTNTYIERFFVYSLCTLMLWHSLKPFKGAHISQNKSSKQSVAEQCL